MSKDPDPQAAYTTAFEQLEREVAARDPEWLRKARTAAIERFAEVGFPTLKDEAWRYTNVAPIAKTAFARVEDGAGKVAAEQLASVSFPGFQGIEFVMINGRHEPTLSTAGSLPKGVRLMPFSKALGDGRDVEGHLGRYASIEGSPFTALNTAFHEDGAFLHVAAKTVVPVPIHLVFLSKPGGSPTMTHPRNLIVLEPGSEATVIESYGGWGPDVYFTNVVTELFVGANAGVDHYKMQRESDAAFHVATLQVHQERASRVADLSVSLGGALVRNDVNTRFADEGGELAMNGLYVVGGTQHVDNHTQIDHAKPHCTSTELYKGILDERARGVFYGDITVRPDAQKTNAVQTNKNLLLSEEALVDSIPGLKIFANDVKCRHGSTIGHLQKDQVFYLQSRGLDEKTARSLLTYAFAAELLNTVRVEPMRATLDEWVLSRLPNSDLVRQAL